MFLFPVLAELLVELFPPFLGEENSGAFELDTPSRPGNVGRKPMRPFHIEVHIVRTPDDHRRRFQFPQLFFDSESVLIVEGCKETFQVSGTLFGPDRGRK